MLSTPDLCDAHAENIAVAEPLLKNLGGRRFFGGEIVTVKCHEDNSRVKELVATPGHGKVMVVDGGGSLRCALLGDMLAEKAIAHGWSGFIIYGCIRDIDLIQKMDIGVPALATVPIKSVRKGIGEQGLTVRFAGIDFVAGEFVYADNNGIITANCNLLE